MFIFSFIGMNYVLMGRKFKQLRGKVDFGKRFHGIDGYYMFREFQKEIAVGCPNEQTYS